MPRARPIAPLIGSLLALLLVPAIARANLHADFNGDGRDDLAIGFKAKHVGGHSEAGAVHVVYGSRHGLAPRTDQFLTEATPGIRGDGPEFEDWFGVAIAAGDFNDDGYDDLAIGVPDEYGPPGKDAEGALHIIYGSRHGLVMRGNQYITQDTPGVKGDGAQEGDGFGAPLTGRGLQSRRPRRPRGRLYLRVH